MTTTPPKGSQANQGKNGELGTIWIDPTLWSHPPTPSKRDLGHWPWIIGNFLKSKKGANMPSKQWFIKVWDHPTPPIQKYQSRPSHQSSSSASSLPNTIPGSHQSLVIWMWRGVAMLRSGGIVTGRCHRFSWWASARTRGWWWQIALRYLFCVYLYLLVCWQKHCLLNK